MPSTHLLKQLVAVAFDDETPLYTLTVTRQTELSGGGHVFCQRHGPVLRIFRSS